MSRRIVPLLSMFVLALCVRASIAASDPAAVIDKAIGAMGGEAKLSAAKGIEWKSTGKMVVQDNENHFTSSYVAQGLDRLKQGFEGDFNGSTVKGATVLDGDKGWRKFGDMTNEMDKDAVANEKRMLYLQVIPVTLVALKDKSFKLGSAGEEKVNDKPAEAVKVTAPDGKDFTLYFDNESGLPVKEVAKVIGWQGEEFTQETTYSDYKDFNGIKKATHVQNKRDGEKFIDMTVTEFKVLDHVPPSTFASPDSNAGSEKGDAGKSEK
jgi:hypothetical protein